MNNNTAFKQSLPTHLNQIVMIYRLLPALVVLLLCLPASAQDTIFYKDGTLRYVKVIQISEDLVTYKNPANPDGPDYVIRKKAVERIGYKNGTSETFGLNGTNTAIPVPAYQFRPNSISLNAIDLMPGLVSVAYERSFKDPRFSLEMTASSAMNSWRFSGRRATSNQLKYYSSSKPFGSTISGFFYGKGQQQNFNFGVGAELGGGLYYYHKFTYTWPFHYPVYYETKGAPYYTVAFAFRCKVIPDKALFVNFDGVIGSQFSGANEAYYDYPYTRSVSAYARLGVNVGYRF